MTNTKKMAPRTVATAALACVLGLGGVLGVGLSSRANAETADATQTTTLAAEDLSDAEWERLDDLETRVVDEAVHRVRKKLAGAGSRVAVRLGLRLPSGGQT